MMKLSVLPIAASLAGLLTMHTAEAALQTWRLEATAYKKYDTTFVPPSFLAPGTKVTIDYVIDVDVPLDPVWESYDNVLLSVTFNGETSISHNAAAYVLHWPGLDAINAGYWSPRSNDGVDFISLNSDDPQPSSTLRDTLADIARNINAGGAELRFDLGSQSIYALPTSLTLVPEPSPTWLFVGALPILALVRKKRLAQ